MVGGKSRRSSKVEIEVDVNLRGQGGEGDRRPRDLIAWGAKMFVTA